MTATVLLDDRREVEIAEMHQEQRMRGSSTTRKRQMPQQ